MNPWLDGHVGVFITMAYVNIMKRNISKFSSYVRMKFSFMKDISIWGVIMRNCIVTDQVSLIMSHLSDFTFLYGMSSAIDTPEFDVR